MHSPALPAAAGMSMDFGGRAARQALFSYGMHAGNGAGSGLSRFSDIYSTPVSTSPRPQRQTLSGLADRPGAEVITDTGYTFSTCVQTCVETLSFCGKPVIHMCTRFVNTRVTEYSIHRMALLHTGLSAAYPEGCTRPPDAIRRSHYRLIPTIHTANNRYYLGEIRNIFRKLWRNEK